MPWVVVVSKNYPTTQMEAARARCQENCHPRPSKAIQNHLVNHTPNWRFVCGRISSRSPLLLGQWYHHWRRADGHGFFASHKRMHGQGREPWLQSSGYGTAFSLKSFFDARRSAWCLCFIGSLLGRQRHQVERRQSNVCFPAGAEITNRRSTDAQDGVQYQRYKRQGRCSPH